MLPTGGQRGWKSIELLLLFSLFDQSFVGAKLRKGNVVWSCRNAPWERKYGDSWGFWIVAAARGVMGV